MHTCPVCAAGKAPVEPKAPIHADQPHDPLLPTDDDDVWADFHEVQR